MYMGLVPTSRRQGHGQEIVAHALATATKAGDHQLVLAVDQANLPAIATYDRAGFTEWDRRSVLGWFPHSDFDKRLNSTEASKS
jgi:ribosomal protein S18 acetylase RimI-like enzyme